MMLTESKIEQTPISAKSPRDVLLSWENAYNQRDPFALIELYADDAENLQVAFGDTPLRGHDALLESFTSFFRAFPDNYTNIENLFVDGEWAIVEWNGGGTFSGALGGAQPTGKSFKLRGCGFFHVVEGKIRFQRGYFDRYTWFSQVGLPIEGEQSQV